MYTLAMARSAIDNPAQFARGAVYVKEGCVHAVRVNETRYATLRFSGEVHVAGHIFWSCFEYDEYEEEFVSCTCTCMPGAQRREWGCRHVAALMIAASGVGTELVSIEEGSAFVDGLLLSAQDARLRPQEAPVHLYPCLRRESATTVMLSLRLGRTRPYVVRSMTELAHRAAARETAVYGRELTFAHREEELSPEDVPLFGQLVMLAGRGAAQGAELCLEGASLDQTMRLLVGRELDVRDAQGATRRVQVRRGALCLPVELESDGACARLRVFAESLTAGAAGAYSFGETELLCAFGQDYERVSALLAAATAYPDGLRFAADRLDGVCARLIAPAGGDVLVRRGQELVSAHTPDPMTARLYVDTDGGQRLLCRASFDYGGQELSPGGETPGLRRDTALEEAVCRAVQRVFPEEVQPGEYAFEGSDDACFSLLSQQLPSLESVGEVMVSERLARANVTQSRAMRVAVIRSDKQGQLLLRADLGGFTQEELTQALAAYRQKRRYVRLSSGLFLSGEALEQAADCAQMLDSLDVTAEEAAAGTEVPESRALYLEEALGRRESIRLSAPRSLGEWMERLRAAQRISAEPPAGLNAQLRGYQLTGLSWLCALSDAGFGGILADDMGLGKTIQVLSLLLREQERGGAVRALVVCPASLQLNWLSEAQRFAPSLRASALMGGAAERARQIAAQDAPNLLITSYDQLRRDVRLYADIPFTHVLLDEAQNIKNAASQAAKAVKTLRAAHRFAMTGTPIENRLGELWSIFDFLMPGYLYTEKRFRERFEGPIVRDADERARENLHLMVAPFILRRMKKDVLTDLPEKVESVMESELTAEQRRIYAAYAARLIKESEGGLLSGQDRMRMLAGLTHLRQLCCDPRLCLEGYTGGSGKLEQLSEVARDAIAGGHRLLIFSQFTSMLSLIRQRLEAEGVTLFVLTGETDKAERMRLVKAFNDGGAQAFLISLKAGGTGLNLTGADVVIHYDPWWNMAAQNQATDRAYRIGQTRGVQVIRMIASDTVEERILALQESKQQLGDGVLLGEETLFTLDADALRRILK
ncbi:MAG: SNF2-related protein [Candidatus Ventricola sp.]